MEKIPKLFVVVVVVFIVVVVVWGDWEEKRSSFFVRAERKKQKSKKSKKSKKSCSKFLSFRAHFCHAGWGAINNHLLQNKINFNSRKLLSPVRPSSRRRRI